MIRAWRVLLLVTTLGVAGCAGVPSRPASPPVTSGEDPFAAGIVRAARSLIGTPYRAGGADPRGMDCSGLVSHVYEQAGLQVPRTALTQQQAAVRVEWAELEPGDLLFFRLPDPHVGIYVGAGEFVHAPGAGRTVAVAQLTQPYFVLGFAGGGRYRP